MTGGEDPLREAPETCRSCLRCAVGEVEDGGDWIEVGFCLRECEFLSAQQLREDASGFGCWEPEWM